MNISWKEGDLRVVEVKGEFTPQYLLQGHRWCYFLDNRGYARSFSSFLPAMLLAKQGYEASTFKSSQEDVQDLGIKREWTSIAPGVQH